MDTMHTRPRINQRFNQQLILWIITGGIVLFAALAGIFWWLGQEAQSLRSVLLNARQKVDFSLYYPERMPTGFGLVDGSLSVTKQVVTYTVGYDQHKSFVVSMQPKGSNFDESAFNPTSDFTTTIGHAYLADLSDRTTAVIVGESSVVIINAPKKVAIDQLTSFINSLRPL